MKFGEYIVMENLSLSDLKVEKLKIEGCSNKYGVKRL